MWKQDGLKESNKVVEDGKSGEDGSIGGQVSQFYDG